MASIDSRYPGRFRARVYIPGVPRVTKTFHSKDAAEAWAGAQETLLRNMLAAVKNKQLAKDRSQQSPLRGIETAPEYRLQECPAPAYTTPNLSVALDRYAKEMTISKKGATQELSLIKRWQKHPLAAFPLLAIKGHHLALHRDWRISIGISGSTLQKEFALISHLYTLARTDWGYEDLSNPVSSFRKAKIGRGRSRRLNSGEEERLLRYCAERGLLRMRCTIILAIETAMRRGELAGLTWSNVDLEARIAYLDDTKNGEPRLIPLSTRAVTAFKSMPRTSPHSVINLHQDNITGYFRGICRSCQIENLKFHDLRHEATSRLFEKGFNMMEVSTITGHKSLSMLKRYTHLKPADLLDRLG